MRKGILGGRPIALRGYIRTHGPERPGTFRAAGLLFFGLEIPTAIFQRASQEPSQLNTEELWILSINCGYSLHGFQQPKT